MMAARTRAQNTTTVDDSQALPPFGIQTIPRFALSASLQGAALAEHILEEFRKDLAAIDLTPKKRRRHAKTRGN